MDDELVQLETIYESPGVLLLGLAEDGEPVGCVGLRSLGQVNGQLVGEMRRLFVRENGRSNGTGRAFVDAVVLHAQKEGFDRLVLNTLPAMTTAHSLYETFGFEPSEPHVQEPAEGTLYFALDLPTT